MFLLNSRLGLVTAAPSSFGGKLLHFTGAPLLPKLRGYLAEFLNQSYLDRLGILYLTTCVGLWYGRHYNSLEAFLGSMASVTSPVARTCVSALCGPDLPGPRPTRLARDNQRPGSPSLLRHPVGDLLTAGSDIRRCR